MGRVCELIHRCRLAISVSMTRRFRDDIPFASLPRTGSTKTSVSDFYGPAKSYVIRVYLLETSHACSDFFVSILTHLFFTTSSSRRWRTSVLTTTHPANLFIRPVRNLLPSLHGIRFPTNVSCTALLRLAGRISKGRRAVGRGKKCRRRIIENLEPRHSSLRNWARCRLSTACHAVRSIVDGTE